MEGGQKMSVFVHAQGIKTVHTGEWGQKMANSVHVVVEMPPKEKIKQSKTQFNISSKLEILV